jgi:hypothetical protein
MLSPLRYIFLTPKSPTGDLSFVAELLSVIHKKYVKKILRNQLFK